MVKEKDFNKVELLRSCFFHFMFIIQSWKVFLKASLLLPRMLHFTLRQNKTIYI